MGSTIRITGPKIMRKPAAFRESLFLTLLFAAVALQPGWLFEARPPAAGHRL